MFTRRKENKFSHERPHDNYMLLNKWHAFSFSVPNLYLQMGKYSGKTCRLLSMLSMTATFFLVEIIVGYITNSVALVADSFHMLSDVVALIVGFSSVRVSDIVNI